MNRRTLAVILLIPWLFATSALADHLESFLPVYQRGGATLEPDLIIDGEAQGILFHRLADLEVDSDGDIFVLDQRRPAILEFSPLGQLLLTIEAVGEGPGDLVAPSQLVLHPNGAIIVYDVGNRRFASFARDGQPLGTAPFQDTVWNLEVSPNGDMYAEIRQHDFQRPDSETKILIVKLSADFVIEAVIDSASILMNRYISEPKVTNVPVPFRAELIWHVDSLGRLVVARSGKYRVGTINLESGIRKTLVRSAPRIKVTAEDRESYFAGVTNWVDGRITHGAPDYIREATEFPEFKPAFTNMLVDQNGYILLEVNPSEGDEVSYDVFRPDLTFLHRVTLPRLSRRAVLARGHVYDIERALDELPCVRRFAAH